ncbi:MAG: toll/interleukin-1 receptor domain-containing protein, partial [Clostridia bacterium]|nr:toll/interleukin-1 receptor domain-containing protein [Clostridia bacterium]
MSNYLGFEPTDRAGFYFISYNTEDAERLNPLVTALSRADVPLWYDYGIEYGDSWAPQINEKLSKSQAVLLFFTKGILQKANSYVKKEYKMAKDYLDKKVYIVLIDEIKPADVPINMLDWWIDITAEQCINAYNLPFDEKLIEQIKKALGIETAEKRMNLLIENYKRLFDAGENDAAEEYFSEYLSGKSLETKAKMFVNIVSKSMEGIELSGKYGELCHQTAYDPLIAETVTVTADPYAIYRDGTARLSAAALLGPGSYQEILTQFGVSDPDDLTFIGYPTDHEGGNTVNSSECVYMIPEHCVNREEAWTFVTSVIRSQTEAVTSGGRSSRTGIGILRNETIAYLNTLRVYEITDKAGNVTGVQ